MVKKLALVFVLLVIAFMVLALFGPADVVSITINGREIMWPLGAAVGIWRMILAVITLFCVAILLSFVFVGVGLVVMGCLALAGIILAAVALPFLLPLLIPLFIVWVFCSIVRRIVTG
jgi:hypothetical protein